MQISLKGIAVVTGGGNGIGESIAQHLAEAGANVAVVDRDEAAAMRVADEFGGTAFVGDVTDQAAVELLAAEIRSAMGPPRYLVNNAGIVSPPGQPFTKNTEEDWDRTFAVNVKGATFWAGALREDLIGSQGRVVNISSIVGIIAAPFLPPYSVSKSAVNGLTKVLARQLAPHGVAVNAVAPGYVWSPMWEDLGAVIADELEGQQGASAEDVFAGRIESLVPMKRPQTPQDIAAMVTFLCSDFASNITGQIIGVDGGVTI